MHFFIWFYGCFVSSRFVQSRSLIDYSQFYWQSVLVGQLAKEGKTTCVCFFLFFCFLVNLLGFFFCSFFFFIYFYQLEANYFTILQWFLSYVDMNQPWIYRYSPSRSPLPPPSPPDSSGSSQCIRPEHFSHASVVDSCQRMTKTTTIL